MELDLTRLRQLARETAERGWHAGRQQSDLLWDASLLNDEDFDAVFDVLHYARQLCGEGLAAVDLGSADGLVAFLMYHCGFAAYGIEMVPERHAFSLELRTELGLEKEAGLALGDWREEEAYGAMGLAVEDVALFYIFPSKSGGERAFSYVGEKARAGAVLAINSVVEPRCALPETLMRDRVFPSSLGQIFVYRKTD